ncbi:MAG: hypothetical protein MRY64_11070 [Hyphomonadaceae bacterium]|nr:hypothetical protein [Hyphomonadaceae bacterium]
MLICRAAELGVAAVRRGPAPCGAARVRAGLGARRVCLALVDRLDLAGPCAAPGAGAGMAFEAPGWVSTAHLARRVAGLQALIAEPERYARLMARRLIGSTRAGRTSPLRPGAPPGLPADLHDLDGSALRLAHSGALAVLNAPP